MDHLGIEQAVVMGTSLGANTALEIASVAPERLRGMVIEMPVLDNGLLSSALTFTPLLVALTFGEPLMKLLARATRAVPRRLLPHYGNVMLDLVRQEPGPGGALLQGLFFGRIAPHRSERRTFQTPALVLGHQRDPCTPSPTPACSPRSCRTGGCWKPIRWWSCACSPSGSRRRSPRSSTRSGAPRARSRNARRQTPARQNRGVANARRASAAPSARAERGYGAGNSSSSFTLTWPGACRAVPIDAAGALLIHSVTKRNAFVESRSLMRVLLLLLDQVGAQRNPRRVGDRGGQGLAVRAVHLHAHPGGGGDQLERRQPAGRSSGRSRSPSAIFGAAAGLTCAVHAVEVSPSIARLGSPNSLAG